jgi:hypothetical protein
MMERDVIRQLTSDFLANKITVGEWFDALFEWAPVDYTIQTALRDMPISAIKAMAQQIKRQLEN